ncbi:Glutamate receptor 1 [Araneus ventricosus]|uniref:Glutamate receptor 1 n=1 Tax=Araneus ventricosus TaxID=182803 RepID=A0A4Y2N3A4_ARAVE|nr:Glutamate receptor 1 [Araneus ventricosus]
MSKFSKPSWRDSTILTLISPVRVSIRWYTEGTNASTTVEEPYLMKKKTEPGVNLEGNESFEGYCKDLADLIADYLKFNYVLKLVNDSHYGGLDSNSPVGWNGMVGELIGKVS